jgi:hypothetical protein
MARIFGTLFGKGRTLAQARASELRGELAHAAVFFACAARPDEAARVMVLLGDAEPDPALRLGHYLRAIATAPPESVVRDHARRRHSSIVVAMTANAPMTAALKRTLIDAASELEAIGDYSQAAHAYGLALDVEAQARALALAGEVDTLDSVLTKKQIRTRDAIALRQTSDDIALLIASGRRREAAAMARTSGDEALRERGRSIHLRRVAGSVVNAIVRGKRMLIALGDEIVIGRAPERGGAPAAQRPDATGSIGSITVAAAAVSRRHIAIARRDGQVVVRDLGSRNATTLRGLSLSGEALVGEGIELRLGGDVPLVVRPTSELGGGAVAIEVAGMRCVACLGPAMLGVGRWRLERGDEGWVELATDDDPPAFAGNFRLAMSVTLLAGDALSAERGAAAVLELVLA